MNDDGQKVEEWAEGENLSLIHDPKLPAEGGKEAIILTSFSQVTL